MTFALASMLLALAPAWAAPRKPEFRLRIGTIAPDGTPWAQQLKDIKSRIERESGGRIKVTLYLAGRRGDEVRLMTQLRQGKLQGVAVSNGAMATVVKEFRVLELPYLIESPEEADWLIDEGIGPELEQRALEHGIEVVVWSENGWRSFGSRDPIRKLEDLAGLKVRSQETPTNLAFWDHLKADDVPIPLDQALIALQSGVIDGFDQTPLYTLAAGWYTQIGGFTLTRHSYQPAMFMVGQGFMESLPEELRVVVRGDRRRESRHGRALVRAETVNVLDFFTRKKLLITPDPDEVKRIKSAVAGVREVLAESIGADLIDRVSEMLRTRRAAASDDSPPDSDR